MSPCRGNSTSPAPATAPATATATSNPLTNATRAIWEFYKSVYWPPQDAPLLQFLPLQTAQHPDIDDADKFLVLQWKLKHIKMAEKPHN